MLLPIGKLTNIALACGRDPSIAKKVRIVWLGSNYPGPASTTRRTTPRRCAMLSIDVPFEIVLVRYGKSPAPTRFG